MNTSKLLLEIEDALAFLDQPGRDAFLKSLDDFAESQRVKLEAMEERKRRTDEIAANRSVTKTRRIEAQKLRRMIIKRDGGKCTRCDRTERLEVHHIKALSESLDNSPENLITLCHSCHLAAHGKKERVK